MDTRSPLLPSREQVELVILSSVEILCFQAESERKAALERGLEQSCSEGHTSILYGMPSGWALYSGTHIGQENKVLVSTSFPGFL